MKEYEYSIPKDGVLSLIKRIIDALSFKICKRWNISVPKLLSELPLLNRFSKYTKEAYGINRDIKSCMKRLIPVINNKK